MKKNNKGFSLVELIVVIALIGVLAALVAPTLQNLFSSEAKKCSSQINSLISKCKIFSMGRQGDVYIRIYEENGNIMGDYVEGSNVISTEQLGGSRAKVSATDPNGAASYSITAATSLYISFNRATGGLRFFGSSQPSAGSWPTGTIESGTAEIEVVAGTKTYTVEIISSTGRHGVS